MTWLSPNRSSPECSNAASGNRLHNALSLSPAGWRSLCLELDEALLRFEAVSPVVRLGAPLQFGTPDETLAAPGRAPVLSCE